MYETLSHLLSCPKRKKFYFFNFSDLFLLFLSRLAVLFFYLTPNKIPFSSENDLQIFQFLNLPTSSKPR